MNQEAPPSLFSRLLPRSLVGQLVFATAIALFVAQAVSFYMLAREQGEQRIMRIAIPVANRIVEVSDRISVGQTPVAARRSGRTPRILVDVSDQPIVTDAMIEHERAAAQLRTLLAEANANIKTVRASELTGPPHLQPLPLMRKIKDEKEREEREDAATARRALAKAGLSGPNARRSALFDDGRGRIHYNTVLVSAQLEDGRWINIILPAAKTDPMLSGLLIGQTLLLYLMLLAPIAWIGWRVSRPLKALTVAARSTDVGEAVDPIPESGPADVSDLTRAFNMMRARIFGMLGEKDRMLGALGHDLRTPLASLRVRVESVDNDALRAKMTGTMDEMAVMLDDILALARSGQEKEAMVATDVGALLSAVVEDYRDVGADVMLGEMPAHIVRSLHPVPMRRVLRNLIDNALNYGTRARVSLSDEGGRAVIRVADDGPGIPPDRIPEMLEPFARAEESRSRETGGAGLGLAIAKTIVTQQGGKLSLYNAPDGGLVAQVVLG